MASLLVFSVCTWADVIIKGVIYLKKFLSWVDASILNHLTRISFYRRVNGNV